MLNAMQRASCRANQREKKPKVAEPSQPADGLPVSEVVEEPIQGSDVVEEPIQGSMDLEIELDAMRVSQSLRL